MLLHMFVEERFHSLTSNTIIKSDPPHLQLPFKGEEAESENLSCSPEVYSNNNSTCITTLIPTQRHSDESFQSATAPWLAASVTTGR